MKGMNKWLHNYENSRHSSGPGQPSQAWASSKYDTQNMTWSEISQIYLPEIGLTFGAAINSLKKLWFSYKMAGKSGTGYRADIAYRINEVQAAMGVPKSRFPELEGMEEESAAEEIQLRKEEEEENKQEDDWNVDQVLGNREQEEEETDDDWFAD